MYLAELSKVFEFDPAILKRSIAWLEKTQDSRGRWIGSDGHSTWHRLSDAEIPCTAYVAWALKRAGRDDTVVLGRAEEFLRKAEADDAYVAALIANAFPTKANHEWKLIGRAAIRSAALP